MAAEVERVPLLIAGSSSAGLACATFCAKQGIAFRILEKNPGPLRVGQADGVQCRTVEILSYFGKGSEILREGWWIKEVCFWADDGDRRQKGNGDGKEEGAGGDGLDGERGLKRVSVTPDTAPGTSHMPHVILNQGRINGLLLEAMEEGLRSRRTEEGTNGDSSGVEEAPAPMVEDVIEYSCEVTDVHIDEESKEDPDTYPVTVTGHKDGKQQKVYKAQYLLGADGAHSNVRKALGIQMLGDATKRVWGVVDTHPRTAFPDIRKKCFLSSKHGSIVVIPREGGTLVRFYIELPPETQAANVSLDRLQSVAKAVFSPHEIEFTDIAWWSAYSIGQRQAECFTREGRVFLAGDAAHTHSPKAGQGMNVSLQDGYNFGWKAGMVIRGFARPKLLGTYVLEREKVATDLIEFDRYWSKLVSKKNDGTKGPERELSEAFDKSRAYTAGITAKYEDSIITSSMTSQQHLAKNVVIGLRLASTRLTRMADAKPMHLSEAMPADGRWRILVFGGDITRPALADKLAVLGRKLASLHSSDQFSTPSGVGIDSFIETLVLLSGGRHAIDYPDLHPYFWPETGKYRLRNLYRVFFDDEAYHEYSRMQMQAYEFYGVDPGVGAIVIIRPDQHVSKIVALDDYAEIGAFFDGFTEQEAIMGLAELVKKGFGGA